MDAPLFQCREFCLAADLRRCGWYVALGTPCLLGGGVFVAFLKQQGMPPDPWGWFRMAVSGMVFQAAALGLLVFVYRWRLRIDQTGLARRRFLRWDLWTWEEFRSGQVQRRGDNFISLERPAWRKTMAFGLLEEPDRKFLLGVCSRMLPPAEPMGPPPTGQLAIRYEGFHSVTFRQDGITLPSRREPVRLDWSNIAQVRLYYRDRESTELRLIELDLPDRMLRIVHVGKVTPSDTARPRISDPNVIPPLVEHFLQSHVPPEKLARRAFGEPPQTHAEYERRKCALEQYLRRTGRFFSVIHVVMLVTFAVVFGPRIVALWQGRQNQPDLVWAVLATICVMVFMLVYFLPFWVLWWYLRKRTAKGLSALEAWRTEFQETASE